ncbi:MAG: CGNR zinc finger domain-containing protein, partial [Candidatus Limnocylindria bacterium]
PAARDLDRLSEERAEAESHARLMARGATPSWDWAERGHPLERPLWPLARAAAELLASDRRADVRECAAGDCQWLFVDESRNRSRRWCSMKSCGNRAKVRRYYQRTRERSGE